MSSPRHQPIGAGDLNDLWDKAVDGRAACMPVGQLRCAIGNAPPLTPPRHGEWNRRSPPTCRVQVVDTME